MYQLFLPKSSAVSSNFKLINQWKYTPFSLKLARHLKYKKLIGILKEMKGIRVDFIVRFLRLRFHRRLAINNEVLRPYSLERISVLECWMDALVHTSV